MHIGRPVCGEDTYPAVAALAGRKADAIVPRFTDGRLHAAHLDLLVCSVADPHLVRSVAAHLVVKGYIVCLTRLKMEVLRDRLIDHGVALGQAVDLYRPVAVQHIVHCLYHVACLGVFSVAL